MLRRWWEYIKQWFRRASERAMDPEVEIEMAIRQAQERDRALRNQAANVVAHRTQLEGGIEDTADQVGDAREMAKQALLRAERSKQEGDAEGMQKWTSTAQAMAMKLQAAENNLAGLKDQYETAVRQSEEAKGAVQQNAMRLQELAAKRMQLMGALQQARMQEEVNKAVEAISATSELEMPSMASVEAKIDRRLAEAQAHAELREATPEGAVAELREAVSMAQADAKLEELKAELGLS